MTRAERKKMLKAEARAWRQLAESFAARPETVTLGDRVQTSDAVWSSMGMRMTAHRDAFTTSTEPSHWYDATADQSLLASLFLALECDDEAAAL